MWHMWYAGAVRSDLLRHWPGVSGHLLRFAASILFRSCVQGAQTIVYCAVVSDTAMVDRLRGKLVIDCRAEEIRRASTNDQRRYHDCSRRLWHLADRICDRPSPWWWSWTHPGFYSEGALQGDPRIFKTGPSQGRSLSRIFFSIFGWLAAFFRLISG